MSIQNLIPQTFALRNNEADYHFMVVGNPVAHSKSPMLHQAFAKQVGLNIAYHRQFCADDFCNFLAVVESFFNGGGNGMNVTVPFKEKAFDLCEAVGELSEFARTAGAVNTLAIKNGKLYGDNTDGRGLVADLLSKGVVLADKNIAILGAGGATRGAILPLLQAGANVTIFNRTLQKAEQLVAIFSPFKTDDKQILTAKALNPQDLTGYFDVIINATSAGTTGQSLNLAQTDISTDVAYDMMYGKQTEFLEHFNNQAVCYDGLGMLINQGALSFELWTGEKVNLQSISVR